MSLLISRAWRGQLHLFVLLALLGGGVASGRCAAATTPEKPARTKKAAAAIKLDELVYSDGDRVRGHFVRKEDDTIVFNSEHFGLLRVPVSAAKVILANPPPPSAAGPESKGEKEEVWAWPFSPVAMAKTLKEIFGSWHGKFAVSSEILTDTAEHNIVSAQAQVDRKWKSDEVQLNAHYDFVSADKVTATDILKADGSWRHDLPDDFFVTYRPTLEWNRNFFRDNEPADYLLLQQELGAGLNLLNTDKNKIRTGLSENVFSVWVTPPPLRSQDTHTVESAFVEAEAKLPWRVAVTDRGVYYYSIARNTEGWENHFEIDKKLTETLTMGVQHEVRTNDPGVDVADYRRLKFLFGLDF